MSVFAITTIGFYSEDYECLLADKTLPETMRRRTVGLFETLEKAKIILEKDYGDLNEAGWYPWAVVEEVPFGLYPEIGRDGELQYFYYYDHDLPGWKPLDGIPQEVHEYCKSRSLVEWFADIG